MGKASVLIVDDERKIRDTLQAYLEMEGFSVLTTASGMGAIEAATKASPDAIVLDLMLPDLTGEEVTRTLREVSTVPILMLTAKSSEDDRVQGLRIGADDYLVKPFSPRELVARIEAILRRTNAGDDRRRDSYGDGALILDRDGRETWADGQPVLLTKSEFDLLGALAARPGRAFSRYELVTRVQGFDYEGYERTIDAHVKNLRRKLDDDPRHPRFVLTVPGVGYKLGMRSDD
jgi:DNA-binding response OmpR family regulator